MCICWVHVICIITYRMVYIADVMYHMVIEYTTYISICMIYIYIYIHITLQHVAHIPYVIFSIHVA